MPAIAYVNGRFVPHGTAHVSVEDRGLQFGDSLYEVIGIVNSKLIDAKGHFDRLDRCLAELAIDFSMPRSTLQRLCNEVAKRNRISEGKVYIQITRGAAKRDFPFPSSSIKYPPSLIILGYSGRFMDSKALKEGISIISVPDWRWRRRDIKTTNLLAQVLACQAARQAGARDAVMVEPDGTVTEGSSSNIWMVHTKNGEKVLQTRHVSPNILQGVTRTSIKELGCKAEFSVVEAPFTLAELQAADEVFLTSATILVLPVIALDGKPIGDGKVGVITLQLQEMYREYICKAGYNEQLPWVYEG